MPLQNFAPLPQANGLSMLGSVILGASDRAANERQKQADLADVRKRQDALLKDERAYQETRDKAQRSARLEDDAKQTEQRAKAAAVQALINEGVLRYEDRQNDQKLAEAYQKAQQLGVIQKYQNLIEGGYLKAEEAGDTAAVKKAMDALGGTASGERARTESLRTRGDTQAQEVARKLAEAEAEERRVLQNLQQLDQIVSTGGVPSQSDVLKEATRRAQAQAGGKGVIPDAVIAQLIPKVTDDLRMQRLDAAAQQQQILQRQLEGVRNIRSTLASQQNVLTNRGSFPAEVTSPVLSPPPAAAAPAARPAGSPMGGFLQQLEQEAARTAPPPPGPAPIQQGQPGWVPPSPPPGLPSGFTPPMRSASTGGRPITPSANIFPTTPPWWRAVA